jgi:hypothetical protein
VDGELMVPVSFDFGAHSETCHLPLGYWGIDNYISQWLDAVSRVCHCSSKAALITSIGDPGLVANVVAWVIYPTQGLAYIQQHMLMHRSVVLKDGGFDYGPIPDRETVSEDGDAISEWTVDLDSLCGAIAGLSGRKRGRI